MTFQQRLQKAMDDGNLRVADLARWFDRPDPTVRAWVRGVTPSGAAQDLADVEHRLNVLVRLIKRRQYFPLPPRLAPADRIATLKEAAVSVLL